MKKRLTFLTVLAALLGLAAVAFPADAPVPQPVNAAVQPPQTTAITITDDAGQKVKVRVGKRDQLRVKTDKRFSVKAPAAVSIPAPPAEFDLTKDKAGKMFTLPMHGNDRYGDCYPVACFHGTELQLGLKGTPTVFRDADVIGDYLRMSPQDQGTSDEDIIPWWKAGIPASTRANKLIDFAIIDPADDASYYAAMYYLGGVVTTHELRTSWESINGSGFVWDNTGQIDPNAGHAVYQAGRKLVNGQPCSITLTWGMYGYLTKGGRTNSDCEPVAVVCTSWFDAKGYTPNGDHYDDIAVYWKGAVGKTLPTGLYPPKKPTPPPPPTPNPTPTPTPGKPFTGTETTTWVNGVKIGPTVSTPTTTTLPTKEGQPYVIDLPSHPLRRAMMLRRLTPHFDDNDVSDYKVVTVKQADGSTKHQLHVTAREGVNWDGFLKFLQGLLPIIEAIIKIFAGFAEPVGAVMDPTTWYAAAGCYWHLAG